jgi:hypothetical protein
VVLRTRDRYPPVIIMGMHTFIHLLAGSQNIFKSKQLKKSKESMNSFVLNFFSEPEPKMVFPKFKEPPNTGKIHIHSSKHWASKAKDKEITQQ